MVPSWNTTGLHIDEHVDLWRRLHPRPRVLRGVRLRERCNRIYMGVPRCRVPAIRAVTDTSNNRTLPLKRVFRYTRVLFKKILTRLRGGCSSRPAHHPPRKRLEQVSERIHKKNHQHLAIPKSYSRIICIYSNSLSLLSSQPVRKTDTPIS